MAFFIFHHVADQYKKWEMAESEGQRYYTVLWNTNGTGISLAWLQRIDSKIKIEIFPPSGPNDYWRCVIEKYKEKDSNRVKGSLITYFCNLGWEKNCEEFYNNKRVVFTTSDSQVRKPLYKSSINSWKKYKDFLKPLQNIEK